VHPYQLKRSIAALGIFCVTLAGCGGGSTAPSTIPNPGVQSAAQAPVGNAAASIAAVADNGVPLAKLKVSPGGSFTLKTIGKAHQFAPAPKQSAVRNTVVYPSDLSYYGGPVMASANVYNVYIDTTPAQVDNPTTFEKHYFGSKMVHVTDQYVGTTASGRYVAAGGVEVSYPVYTALGDNDVANILHAVGSYYAPTGSSTNIYNLFLAPGMNYCGSGSLFPAGGCNASITSPSPAFCAFHSELQFGDIGEMLYTMEPFADVNYCAVNAYFPNAYLPQGQQADSQYSLLSHELTETITDPIPGTGWVDNNAPAVTGEIGDLCAYVSSQNVALGGTDYFIQAEYSNKIHGCTTLSPTPPTPTPPPSPTPPPAS